MASVNSILLKSQGGTLTCSEVLDLMMSQPTHDETSHAQLHLLDDFHWDPMVWKTNYVKQATPYKLTVTETEHVLTKQAQWAPASHLTPKGSQMVPTFTGKPTGPGLQMDETRLAQSDKYSRRTGHDELPGIAEKTGKKLIVLKLPIGGKGKPVEEDITNAVEATKPPYNDPKTYVHDKKTAGAKVMEKSLILAKSIPIEPARPPHSMFPDSESMVDHIAGAFLSDAGVSVLGAVDKAVAGAGDTFCIYSKTAVKAVRALKNSGKVHEMALRTMDTDKVDKRKELGTHTEIAKIIDHVVVVLRKHADGSLLIVTAYPSDATTSTTMGFATGPDEDVEEILRATYTKTSQVKPLPKLIW